MFCIDSLYFLAHSAASLMIQFYKRAIWEHSHARGSFMYHLNNKWLKRIKPALICCLGKMPIMQLVLTQKAEKCLVILLSPAAPYFFSWKDHA